MTSFGFRASIVEPAMRGMTWFSGGMEKTGSLSDFGFRIGEGAFLLAESPLGWHFQAALGSPRDVG